MMKVRETSGPLGVQSLKYMRNRFKKGAQDSITSEDIVRDCGLEKWSSLARMIGMMYHVDTYTTTKGEERGWRPQGYVYIKDLVNLDINVTGVIASMDDEYIIFFSCFLPYI